jgi:hypothetical protein
LCSNSSNTISPSWTTEPRLREQAAAPPLATSYQTPRNPRPRRPMGFCGSSIRDLAARRLFQRVPHAWELSPHRDRNWTDNSRVPTLTKNPRPDAPNFARKIRDPARPQSPFPPHGNHAPREIYCRQHSERMGAGLISWNGVRTLSPTPRRNSSESSRVPPARHETRFYRVAG